MDRLTEAQRDNWMAKGYLAVPRLLDGRATAALAQWVGEIAEPAAAGARRLHYFEQTAHGRTLCRTERFVEDHAALAALICDGRIQEIAGKLLGEPARLYKEKINYKAAGGGGYAPHQDAPAYTLAAKLVTCVIAVDEMTAANGCLEFSPGAQPALLPQDADGCIAREVAAALPWVSVPAAAGDAIFFTAYVPHRSAGNPSDRPRRALYLTYHAAAEGPLRDRYYSWRDREIAAAAADGRPRVSTIGDFLGRIVP